MDLHLSGLQEVYVTAEKAKTELNAERIIVLKRAFISAIVLTKLKDKRNI
jgi:hypothetical protein